MLAGPELDINSEAGSTIPYSAPASPSVSPEGVPSLGPKTLMRGLSGAGLGRLHRVGSNPLNDMNRHSLPQVWQPFFSAAIWCVCMSICLCKGSFMLIC